MIDLNNLEEIKKLDPKDVYGSTELFVNQCQQMFDTYAGVDFYDPKINPGFKEARNIVICGMGGSAYGGHIVNSLFYDTVTVPISVVSDYHLPGFVDENSLVLLTSYSGSTEEVLSCAKEAQAKGAKITGFSSGGNLETLFKQEKLGPGFSFNPTNNPSAQPRLGTGYIVLGTILLLRTLSIIDISKEEIQNGIGEVRKNQETIKHHAMKIAKKLQGYIPVTFAAEHLIGNAHIMRNQFNETAKSFSAFEDLPELNHHLMEGLQNPKDKELYFLFLESSLYSDILKKRISLTKDVISKNNIEYTSFDALGTTKFSQMLCVLSFGGFTTVYLALLYGLDPSLIPWVDYFKEKMKE